MSDLFIASQLRPQVGPQKANHVGRKLLRPLPDLQGPQDQVLKCREKWNEKCKEKLFQEKLGDIKRCGEKHGDKPHGEKLGDKRCGEKLDDIKNWGEKRGDKCRHNEKLGDKLHGEKHDDIKRHGEKFGDKGSFPEKLDDIKRCGEKIGDKAHGEKFGDKGCFEKHQFPEVLDPGFSDPFGMVPSDRFFVKRG